MIYHRENTHWFFYCFFISFNSHDVLCNEISSAWLVSRFVIDSWLIKSIEFLLWSSCLGFYLVIVWFWFRLVNAHYWNSILIIRKLYIFLCGPWLVWGLLKASACLGWCLIELRLVRLYMICLRDYFLLF